MRQNIKKITKKGRHWMKQRRRNKQNTCIHEQKKPEEGTKQGRKLHGKTNKELLMSNFTPPSVPQGKCLENNKARPLYSHSSQFIIHNLIQ